MSSKKKYDTMKSSTMAMLKEAMTSGNFTDVIGKTKSCLSAINENEMKNMIENLVRQILMELLVNKAGVELLENVFKFSITAAIADICPGNLPVLVFGDMLDGSTLTECEKIFSFIESSAEVFKKDIFFKTCRNQLLRSCNDLLRRLSRSQNTVFCGRILLFLARIFPFSERSGLNIISEFNLDNLTRVSSHEDDNELLKTEKEEPIDDDKDLMQPIKTNYNLYRKFWHLQEFFRNPPLCYNKLQWRTFLNYATGVMTVFGSFKSDTGLPSHIKHTSQNSSTDKDFAYFAKFLTSPKLLELELSDSNFRRVILVQFLILFQYLQSPVKFKLESYVLTEDQITWINDMTNKVYKFLADTPPDGPVFCETVKCILKREEYWNAWKNDGCPNFKTAEDSAVIKASKKRKERLGDILDQQGKVFVGNDELNRLWNICPDNWEACRSKKRKFVPSMEKFFENAIYQADPANHVATEDKDVNDPNFCWKGLRLLSMKSPHFFSVNNVSYKKTADYIEAMVQKLPKESSELETEESNMAEENYEDGNEEMFPTSEDESTNKENKESQGSVESG